MNYENIYYKLIESRKLLLRSKTIGDYERHHILPVSLGGTNHKSNLVLLTPREHYLAHWLLYKFQIKPSSKAKMAYAFMLMAGCNNPNQKRNLHSRGYEAAKKAVKESCTGINHPGFGKNPFSEEHLKHISKSKIGPLNPMYGKIPWNKGLTSETCEVLKNSSVKGNETKRLNSSTPLGKKHTEESKLKMSQSMKGIPKSEEHRRKLSESLKGRKLPEAQVAAMSINRKGVPQKTEQCPYCNKIGGVTAMKRWHFEHCKLKV